MTVEQGRQGDVCEECGGRWLVMVAHFDHRLDCSHFPPRLREKIERDRAFARRLAEERASAAERRTGNPSAADRDRGREATPPSGPPPAALHVVDLVAAQRDRDDRMDRELRGGFEPTPGVCSIHDRREPCDICLSIADERWASRD